MWRTATSGILLGVLALACGCGSDTPRRARAESDGGRRGSSARPAPAAEDNSPQQVMGRIEQVLAACPDLPQRLETYVRSLEPLTAHARKLTALQPVLDRLNALRRRQVTVLGVRVNAWQKICQLSSSASALNSGINLLEGAVQRAARMLALHESLQCGQNGWQAALSKARRDRTRQRVRILCRQAEYLHTDVVQMEQVLGDQRKYLGTTARVLRTAKAALDGVQTRGVQDVAEQMSRLLGRPLAVTDEILPALRRGAHEIKDVQQTLRKVSQFAGRLGRP
jgi:hypothetical protein